MYLCDWVNPNPPLGESFVCLACGKSVKRDNTLTHLPYHRSCDNQESRGFGDTISNFLSKIGIKKKKSCGCKKRQNTLNKLFPYKK